MPPKKTAADDTKEEVISDKLGMQEVLDVFDRQGNESNLKLESLGFGLRRVRYHKRNHPRATQ